MVRRKYRKRYQYQLKKSLVMVKQLHTNSNLFVALDLCQLHYQNLLDIYQKDFIMISPQIINLNLSFKDDQLIFRCFEWKKELLERL